MDDFDREKLIDYVLGRTSTEETLAFKENVKADSSLARAVSTLQNELVNISSRAEVNNALDEALRRRFESAISGASASKTEFGATRGSSSEEGGGPQNVSKPNSRRFRFIPKRVVVPRREETSLIFKRASVLADEERSRRLLKSSRVARMRRRSSGGGYHSAKTIPNAVFNVSFSASSFDDRIPCFSSSVDFWGDEDAFVVSSADFNSVALRVEPEDSWTSISAIKVVPSKVDASPLIGGGFEKLFDVSVEACSSEPSAASKSICFETVDETEALSRFTLNPLTYAHGSVKPSTRFRRAKPYSFDEFQNKPVVEGNESQVTEKSPELRAPLTREEALEVIVSPERRGPLTREEVLEEIAAIFGQNASILQRPGIYLAVAGADIDEEENGPTLSAEDLRLAELLGHAPSAIERNEYYWEDEDSEDAAFVSGTKLSLPTRLFLIATAPPACVGRVVLKMFRGLENKSVEYSERGAGVTRRHDGPEPGRLIDAAVPLIAGIALAVGVVFPMLKYVATEIFITVAESKVRKLSGNLTVSPHDPEIDVIPFISEQILFPHYETVEFGDEAGRNELESDGYPVTSGE